MSRWRRISARDMQPGFLANLKRGCNHVLKLTSKSQEGGFRSHAACLGQAA